jgi:monofunctional glycosyltransferase
MAQTAKRDARSPVYRFGWFLGRAIIWFVVISVIWVMIYRFVPPPITMTMIGDVARGETLNRDWMSLSEIDPDMSRAVIAGEDAKFCTHDGFDREAIEKAMASNSRGRRLRGGSTISQQTAKNAFLWQGGGYVRKALEAWFTLLIENIWGKKRIMEVYLNIAETGIGTYGVNAGSLRYFGHDAAEMTPTEAARIAAVLPLPKKREAIAPRGFVKRHGNRLARTVGVVRRDALDGCLG